MLNMIVKVTAFLFIYLPICTSQDSIQYECTSNKQIRIDGAQDLSKLRVLKNDGQACEISDRLIDACSVKAGESVTLILQDDPAKQVIGGLNSHTYHLGCSEEGTYTVTMAPPIWNVRPKSPEVNYTKVIPHALSLTLTAADGSDLGAKVEIGQVMKMTLKTTDRKLLLSPQECTAKAVQGGSTYKIWEEAGDCKHDPSITVKKWKSSDQQTLSITVYGFYFPTSTQVTIECNTRICLTGNTATCQKTCIEDVRRRRGAGKPIAKNETVSYVKSVQVSFDVAVNEAGANSAIGIMPQKQVFGLIGITVYVVMQII